ncbi:MAG: hypothetical protein JWN98_2455 [Abditibacteriota bacterium]|nr:hypothetical protein [Abditibacteriota bacterium]
MRLTKRRVEALQEAVPSLYDRHRAIVPWLNGVGVGKKVVAGVPTNEEAVTFFVNRKMPPEMLTDEWTLPRQITVTYGKRSFEIPTDVIELGDFEFLFALNCLFENPVRGGTCVASMGGNLGTQGGVVRDPNGNAYLISNAHVLSGINNQFPLNHPIVQPANSPRTVANLARTTTITTGITIFADAAIARYQNNALASSFITNIGPPTGIGAPFVGQPLRKSGAATGLSFGTVKHVNITHTIGPYLFSGFFLTSVPTALGDSGAFVLDPNGAIIGMVFARVQGQGGGHTYSACVPMGAVIQQLGLQGWSWV